MEGFVTRSTQEPVSVPVPTHCTHAFIVIMSFGLFCVSLSITIKSLIAILRRKTHRVWTSVPVQASQSLISFFLLLERMRELKGCQSTDLTSVPCPVCGIECWIKGIERKREENQPLRTLSQLEVSKSQILISVSSEPEQNFSFVEQKLKLKRSAKRIEERERKRRKET